VSHRCQTQAPSLLGGRGFSLNQNKSSLRARHDFLPKTEWLASHSHEVTADS